jgi:hypothetical protein
MRFEISYGHEVSVPKACDPYCVVASRVRMSTGIYCDVGTYHSPCWNTVWLKTSGADPSSVCSRFAITSNKLYPAEVVRLGSEIAAFTADISFPDLDTIDRQYFGQIMAGIMRSAVPYIEAVAILNHEDFVYGDDHAVFSLSLSEIPSAPICLERADSWLQAFPQD